MNGKKSLIIVVLILLMSPSLGSASDDETKHDSAALDGELLDPKSFRFLSPSTKFSRLPWDDTYVSREGMVMLNLVPASRGCSIRLRRPHDGISLRRDDQFDATRYSGYELHDQILGSSQRRLHVDVLDFLNSGCANFDSIF